MKYIYYSNEQIERLSQDSRIKHINQHSIRFTLEYRLSIYERISYNICTPTVRQVLIEDGFNREDIQSNIGFCGDLAKNLRLQKPCGAKNQVFLVSNSSKGSNDFYHPFLLES